MTHPIAVVTGAGAGIGRAVVRLLAEAGCDIALVGRNAGRLADAASELGARQVRAEIFVADVGAPEEIEAVADRIEDELGPISIWINAAGAAAIGTVSDLSTDDIDQTLRMTALSAIHGTRAALARMRRRGRGRIVNLGLMPGLRDLPLNAAGNAAHAAVEAFCAALRPELRAQGDRIDITIVHLPSLNTPRLGWSRNRTGHTLRPFGTPYEPEAAAQAIVRAAFGGQRDIWVGLRTVPQAAFRAMAPGLRDQWLGRFGIPAQIDRHGDAPADAADTLTGTAPGAFAAHGSFETVRRIGHRHHATIMAPGLRGGMMTGAIMALVWWMARRRR